MNIRENKENILSGKALSPAFWLLDFAYIGLLALIYRSAMEWLIGHDWQKPDYSYCWLIPFIVLYMIWEKREQLRAVQGHVSWKGLIPLGLGIVLFWLGELGGEYYTLYISLWLVIIGILWLHMGWGKLRHVSFALVMSLTMFPLPNIFNNPLSLRMKLISSELGVSILHVYGMTAYREGNVIDLGFTQLQVVDACSGLRYVVPLFVMSLVLAYCFRASLWKRAVVLLSSLPIAIAVNSFRIAATGILYSIWGAAAAEEFFHGFSAWLLFLITIPILLIEMKVLRWLPPRDPTDHSAKGQEKRASLTGIPGQQAGLESKKASNSYIFLVPVALLGLTAAGSHLVDFRERVPVMRPLREVPIEIAGWSGTREAMEGILVSELKLSDYAIINYREGRGRSVNFYAAFYETQRKGESTHSPETCLPGSGWEFREAGLASIRLGDAWEMRVKRAFMEKSGSRQLTYYWFQQRGRILTDLYRVKLYGFWDALTRQRTDGALVRLITPVYPNEEVTNAEERLQGFTKEIVPILDEFIPK